MIPLPLPALCALLAAAAVAGAYLQGRSDGRAVCQAEDARDQRVVALATEAAASATAAEIARIRVNHVTVRQEVEREVRENVVYRDCSHGVDQLHRINAALTGASAPQPAGGSQLPAADTSNRPQLRRDHDQVD